MTSPTGPPPMTQTCAPKAASAAKSGASEIIAPPFAAARLATVARVSHGGGRASAPGKTVPSDRFQLWIAVDFRLTKSLKSL